MKVQFSILLCLSAPTASYVSQPHSAFLPRRLGVRLGTSYLESSSSDANKVTSAFIRPVVVPPSTSTEATATATKSSDGLDQKKFLGSMDRDIDAMRSMSTIVNGCSIGNCSRDG
ncbi:hypothetical protein MHU86_25412 [Fragilaria crotonensis]|nr:hypothetical protein MHU86_25412 [Fragilaria crotonensis]